MFTIAISAWVVYAIVAAVAVVVVLILIGI